MSRFFTASDSSSEESSGEELYSDEEESQEEESDEETTEESDEDEDDSDSDGSVMGANKFLKDADDGSDESDDEDRVKSLKSAKDKRFEELEGTIKQMENAVKINDWQVVNTGEFCTWVFQLRKGDGCGWRLTGNRVQQVEPVDSCLDQAE
jgi:translation initiation factor 3 subunit C